MIPYIFSLANIKAKPLKIMLTDEYRLRKTDVMSCVKGWIWNNIIYTKFGWRDDVDRECIRYVDEDIELMVEERAKDMAEEYSISRQEAMD